MSIKQKLVIIAGFYPRFKGGAEYQMRLIADHLKEDFDIVFIYLGDVPGDGVQKTNCQIIDGYKVYFIKSPNKIDEVLLRYPYSRRIYNVLKKEKPNFVYQRVLKFISYYISSFQKELGYKHFIHIADLFTLQFNNRSVREKVNYRFFKSTLKNNPQFIIQTNEQLEVLNGFGIEPALHIYNMHPTLELNIEKTAENKLDTRVKHIVWIANIKPIKNLEAVLFLANSLIERKDIHFDIIGNIQNKEYGVPIVERLNKLPNVTHYIDKDNIFVNGFILKHAHLTINTSHSEGFSNVFIQSWLRGVPVLSLNSNPDNLFDRVPEFGIVCANDLEKLRDTIDNLLDSKSYVERASVCYRKSMDLFSFKNIDKIKKLLEK